MQGMDKTWFSPPWNGWASCVTVRPQHGSNPHRRAFSNHSRPGQRAHMKQGCVACKERTWRRAPGASCSDEQTLGCVVSAELSPRQCRPSANVEMDPCRLCWCALNGPEDEIRSRGKYRHEGGLGSCCNGFPLPVSGCCCLQNRQPGQPSPSQT
jgi:hypothetical protein